MADVSQIKLPNGSVYDLIDEKSGYITAEYIENKTDYEIPVSRVGEIVVGETAIGTDSTNFPTSKAVVDYVDERVVQEMDAIDVGVISVNGKTGSVTLSASDVGAATINQIPTSTSQLTNDSGYVVGPSSSVNNHVATFNGTTGNTIQDSGYTIAKSVPSSAVFTDQQVKSTVITSGASHSYPILLHSDTSSTQTASASKMSNFYLHYATSGSDRYYLQVQNASLASEYLTLARSYNSSWYYTKIVTDSTPTNSFITLTLPKETGTIALTSDIPTVPTNISSFTNDSGYLTASDIASVMTYKGTKANYAALPSTGNTTGDVWHLTDTGAEWAWDGSAWQELGTAIDLSNYATKATTLAGYGITDAKIENGTITLGSNTITPLTSFTETDPTVPSWAKASTKPSYGLTEISGTDDLRAIEALTGTSGLLKKTAANTWTLDTNTYLTSYTETDPTVPSWAKQSSKPTYTAAEVGALPDSTVIPSKTSDLTNDSGFITSYTDEKLKVTYNTSIDSFYPILTQTSGIAETKKQDSYFRFDRNSNSEVELCIGGNGSANGILRLFTTTTGGWVRLSTQATNSRTIVLPDKTGTVALTSDIPTVPTKVSDLTNDSGFISSYTETDPVFNASAAAGITSTDISNWNAKVSDDKTWNGVTLNKAYMNNKSSTIVPIFESGAAYYYIATATPSGGKVVLYDNNAYLNSTTPSANDNSTKVATTAYVDAAIPKVYSSTNTGGYLTMATLPIYDGTVV